MMMDFFGESLAKSLGDGTPLSLTDYLNRAYLNSFWFYSKHLKDLGPFSLFPDAHCENIRKKSLWLESALSKTNFVKVRVSKDYDHTSDTSQISLIKK